MTINQQCSIALNGKEHYTRCPNNAKHREVLKDNGFRGKYSYITYLCEKHYKEKMEVN